VTWSECVREVEFCEVRGYDVSVGVVGDQTKNNG